MTQDFNRKIDFRISDFEYRVLRILAYKKNLSVSAFCRQMVGAVVAPTAVALTDDLLEQLETELQKETGKVLR